MKYLQASYLLKMNFRYKVCIVCNNRKKLWKLITTQPVFKIGGEKRCGWVGFVYFKHLKDACQFRKKLYFRKDLYVFLQDDRPIYSYK